jgi:putative transposase
MMALVAQLPSGIAMRSACMSLGLCRAGIYRERKPHQAAPVLPRKPSPRRLADVERHKVLNYLHSKEFMDQAPREVYATLLSRGIYLASTRTMYRILADSNESRERRAQRPAQKHAKPVLEALRPNQVWTWDITKLCGPKPGVFYNAYVIIDLYSRYVVGGSLLNMRAKSWQKHCLLRRSCVATLALTC